MQYSGYDLRGNRTVEYHEQAAGIGGYMGVDRTFSYDANRRLTGSRSYFADGSTWTRTSRPGEAHEVYEIYDYSRWLSEANNYAYDADGRLIYQENWRRPDNQEDWVAQASQTNTDNRQTYDTSVLGVLASRVEYVDANGNSTYDGTGKATGYRTYAPGYMHTYTTTYEGWESYREKTVSGTSSNSSYKPTTNTLTYDLVGRLTSQQESTRLRSGAIDDRIRYYAYNGDGQVQTRREGTLSDGQFVQNGTLKQNYLYAYGSGQQLAQVMEGSRIVSLNGTGLYEAGGNKVVTLAGETLRQLAQRVYGKTENWVRVPFRQRKRALPQFCRPSFAGCRCLMRNSGRWLGPESLVTFITMQ